MVLQDTWLFGGTIRENIAYGRPGATDEEVLEAARATYVDRFVHSLPDGYDTVLNAEADNISAGERQLITIARAFLAAPALLILDEATSRRSTPAPSCSCSTPCRRCAPTARASSSRTGSRRSAMPTSSSSWRTGRIVERGSHAELLAAGGAFAKLYAAQFQGAATDLDEDAGCRGRSRQNSSVRSGGEAPPPPLA